MVGTPLIVYRQKKHDKKAKEADTLRNEVYDLMRPLSDLLYSLGSNLSFLKPSVEIEDIDINRKYPSEDEHPKYGYGMH